MKHVRVLIEVLCIKTYESALEAAVLYRFAEHTTKRSISRLNRVICSVAPHVRQHSLRIKIEDIRRVVQNLGELLDHGILRRISPVMLQIIQVGRKNIPAISASQTLRDCFLPACTITCPNVFMFSAPYFR